MRKLTLTLAASFLFLTSAFLAEAQIEYQLPPQEIIDLVDAPSTPGMSISPNNNIVLLTHRPERPTIDQLAAPELRLAGMRFNPVTLGTTSPMFITGLTFTNLDGTNPREVQGLPAIARISNVSWSRDSKFVAFTHTAVDGIELWVTNVESASAKQLTGRVINDVLGQTFAWLPDNSNIIFSAVVEGKGAAPQRPAVARGPIVQESLGRRAAVRTFQDLLRDVHDEEIFEHYATSQLAIVNLDGNIRTFGQPGIYNRFSPSPDGNYILVTRTVRPFSFIVPVSRFPQVIEIVDLEGNLVKTLAEVPLTDNLPQGFDATRAGPRSQSWRADAPATLVWAEALDGGDPSREVEFRDRVFMLDAPFAAQPTPIVDLELRYSGITWGNENFALISQMWRRTRRTIQSSFNPSQKNPKLTVIFDRSTEDGYNDPGRFQTTQNQFGMQVLMFGNRDRSLYLFGMGASPEGNKPFVDEFEIKTRKTKRLWQSLPPFLESPVVLLDPAKGHLITNRQSVNQQPNFFLRDLRRNRMSQITNFPDPTPALRYLYKEVIHYQRADGIPLSGTLYLPKGYTRGIDPPLPTLLWAYPQEFKSADAAGQITGSPFSFTRVGPTSPIILATQGYAVLDNASFPIVGEGDKEPNDTFVEQLVKNAEAAINKLVEMGVTDPERVAVSGHSYGAFMTANLLAHSNLFAAGIARSGAYNRTLTPFGFQGEERTYWQAPGTYNLMSPFMHADKVKAPMLVIHGGDDNNAGTFPIQSERFYDALRGLGATTRLVMLPHEGHGYTARESVLHMHWEWIQWLDRYVKNKPRSDK